MKQLIETIIVKSLGFYLNTLYLFAPKRAAEKALTIFTTPRKGRLQQHQKPFLNTAKQDTLTFDNLSIKTYEWEGSKNTVLLVHGWESNTKRWHKLIKILKKQNHHIIALDAPAHGQSSGKHFNAIVYAKCINEVAKVHQPEIIVGHSVGGMSSIFFLKMFNYQSLKKLVLLGAPSEFTKIFKNYTSMLGFSSKLEQKIDTVVEERFGHPPSYFSSAKFIKDHEAEGLIIHDTNDKIIAYSEAELIASHFKNAKLITTNGFGHSLNNDEVNNCISEFINL